MKFMLEEKEVINKSFNGDFIGVWHELENSRLSIDVFELEKKSVFSYTVYENGVLRFEGLLMNCLKYIHKWL